MIPPTIVLTAAEVRALLPMSACIELMREAFRALARGDVVNPLRPLVRLPGETGFLGLMPGYLGSPQALGLKAIAVFPGNHGTAYDAHQGIVVLFDPKHGIPIAIMDASEITAIRTAAASGAATDALARKDASDLAIIGSGVQARTHLAAMLAVRPIRRVRVYSTTSKNREAFARRESARNGVTVEARASAREAVDGADIICTTTSAREPVVLGEWIAPGAHVNAVGACIPATRELDAGAVKRARLFVDSRESALNEAGDFIQARKEGAVDDDHILGEIGEVLLGRCPGRRHDEEITLFESLGVAVEDLAAARYVHDEARRRGVGTTVNLGGLRDAGD
ncbi:MAG: ornithine cyclodeaminase family protein [Acidobacteriota bacterium]|nr:ornithine cyclodeaminase family protein [Acidobacteriota bacterium]